MRTKPSSQLPDATGVQSHLRFWDTHRLMRTSQGINTSRHVTPGYADNDFRCPGHRPSGQLFAFSAGATPQVVELRGRTPVAADAARRGASP